MYNLSQTYPCLLKRNIFIFDSAIVLQLVSVFCINAIYIRIVYKLHDCAITTVFLSSMRVYIVVKICNLHIQQLLRALVYKSRAFPVE